MKWWFRILWVWLEITLNEIETAVLSRAPNCKLGAKRVNRVKDLTMTFLLPKSSAEEFQLKEYWDSFFSKRTSSFEWYGDYIDLCHILHKYLKPSCKILMAGCGNSKLSEDLYDAGFNSIDNIDISDIVIRQMRSKNQVKRKEMTFSKMDILDMSFDDSAYDCVLDKGTLDAIFSNNDDVTVQKVTRMFDEIKRVIKVTGRYICITLAQEHILTTLLKYFECGWLLRVHKVKLEVNKDSEMVGGALPVFVFVCTKMAHREGQSPIKVMKPIVKNKIKTPLPLTVSGSLSFVPIVDSYIGLGAEEEDPELSY